jgi:predicted peptidase
MAARFGLPPLRTVRFAQVALTVFATIAVTLFPSSPRSAWALPVAMEPRAVTSTAPTTPPAPLAPLAYQACVFHSVDGATMPFRLLVPRRYNPKKRYPLVLFLHGDGETGDDNTSQLRNGGDVFLQPKVYRRWPAFVIFPQMPKDSRWVDVAMDNVHSMVYPPQPSASMRLAMNIVASVEQRYQVDPRRVYVMGVSDGGFGVWDALIRYPGLFAAGISMCGGADPAKASAVLHTPIWVFHSTADTDVYLTVEKDMVDALHHLHDRHLQYTEYTDVDHSPAFTRALADPGLLPWLFTQKLPK